MSFTISGKIVRFDVLPVEDRGFGLDDLTWSFYFVGGGRLSLDIIRLPASLTIMKRQKALDTLDNLLENANRAKRNLEEGSFCFAWKSDNPDSEGSYVNFFVGLDGPDWSISESELRLAIAKNFRVSVYAFGGFVSQSSPDSPSPSVEEFANGEVLLLNEPRIWIDCSHTQTL